MNTNEINEEMKSLKCFIGTFPRDLIPMRKFEKRPLALILNTDKSSQPGKHWIAVFINENNVCEYFDSFGYNPMCCDLHKFLKLNKIKTILYNSRQIQSVISNRCGNFCILFIKMRCNRFSFEDFLKLFSKYYIKNDLLVTKL